MARLPAEAADAEEEEADQIPKELFRRPGDFLRPLILNVAIAFPMGEGDRREAVVDEGEDAA